MKLSIESVIIIVVRKEYQLLRCKHFPVRDIERLNYKHL